MHRATRKPRAPALHSHSSSDLSGTWFSHLSQLLLLRVLSTTMRENAGQNGVPCLTMRYSLNGTTVLHMHNHAISHRYSGLFHDCLHDKLHASGHTPALSVADTWQNMWSHFLSIALESLGLWLEAAACPWRDRTTISNRPLLT